MSPSADQRARFWLTPDETLAVTVVVACLAIVHIRPVVPMLLVGLALAAAAMSLSPRWMILAVVLLLAHRTNSAIAALDGAPTRPLETVIVELMTDPKPRGSAVTAEVELDGDRMFASARLRAGATLSALSAGDEMTVSGTARGRLPSTSWALSRRIVGSLDIATVHDSNRAGGVRGAATTARDHLRRGAASLSPDDRALFTGLVFGDDRHQSLIDSDNFRAAGLGHLLAVSGQNVLFVLVLAAPLLSRIRSLDRRVIATIVVLIFFGFMTRFEPSVMRALVMAGMATVATSRGRPDAAVHTLPLAVAALLLIDPLLGLSLAFLLSVTATAGLILVSPRLVAIVSSDDRQRRGATITKALATTAGAQLAVAPLLLATFGSVSPVAIPANLLAGPAAAFVMMWGLTAGAIAGFGPDELATILHLPTRAAIFWIDQVAATAADIPTGAFTIWHVGFVVAAIVALGIARSAAVATAWQFGFGLLALAAPLLPLMAGSALGPGTHTIAPGVTLTRSSDGHDVVVLDSTARSIDAMGSIRTAHVGRIDLLVATSGGRETGRLVGLLTRRFSVTDVWAPAGHQVPGARVIPSAGALVGSLVVSVNPNGAILVRETGVAGDTVGPDGFSRPKAELAHGDRGPPS